MTLLSFSKPKPKNFPLTILWPTTTPLQAMPPQTRRLPDGRLEATYTNLATFRLSVESLALSTEAARLGGVIRQPEQNTPTPTTTQPELFHTPERERSGAYV